MLTLWDLLEPITSRLRGGASTARTRKKTRARIQPAPAAPPTQRDALAPAAITSPRTLAPSAAPTAEPARESAQVRYDRVTRAMLAQFGIKVRKWRSGMSGVAWELRYQDGSVKRFIESPRPKGPMSAAVFLHEIGHHAIGFRVYKPRCLEEFHAWRWSLEAMEREGLNISDAVRYRMHSSLHYAINKARRRGIKDLPAELTPYLEKPTRAKHLKHLKHANP